MVTRVFIIPAGYKDIANGYAAFKGWGEPVFVQPLSPSGLEPVTHWGFPAVVGSKFLHEWDNPEPEAAPLVSLTYVDTREGDDTGGHFRDALAAMGLRQIEQDGLF